MGKQAFIAGIALLLCVISIGARHCRACTALACFHRGTSAVGYNMDWPESLGSMTYSPAGVINNSVNPGGLTWKSKYKTIKFGIFGSRMPFAGVNEKGLKAFCFGTGEVPIDPRSKEPYVTELELIDLVLETTKSTAEAADLLNRVRVTPIGAKGHYLFCDERGCIVVDFQDGLRIHKVPRDRVIVGNDYHDKYFLPNGEEHMDPQISGRDLKPYRIIDYWEENKRKGPISVHINEGLREVRQTGVMRSEWNVSMSSKNGDSILTIKTQPYSSEESDATLDLNKFFASKKDSDGPEWISLYPGDDPISAQSWEPLTKEQDEILFQDGLDMFRRWAKPLVGDGFTPEPNALANLVSLQSVLRKRQIMRRKGVEPCLRLELDRALRKVTRPKDEDF